MVKRILIRPKANVDIDEQFSYIAERNFYLPYLALGLTQDL